MLYYKNHSEKVFWNAEEHNHGTSLNTSVLDLLKQLGL